MKRYSIGWVTFKLAVIIVCSVIYYNLAHSLGSSELSAHANTVNAVNPTTSLTVCYPIDGENSDNGVYCTTY